MSSSEEDQLPKSSRLAIPKFDQLKDFDKSSSARRDATCKKSKLIKQASIQPVIDEIDLADVRKFLDQLSY